MVDDIETIEANKAERLDKIRTECLYAALQLNSQRAECSESAGIVIDAKAFESYINREA